jgi:NAD/NADP transhydrogenase alpha subunit
MNASQAFAAIALAAVACDGTLDLGEAKALRGQLQYRSPYADLSDLAMAELLDSLLADLRQGGLEALVSAAVPALSVEQRETALAVAAQLVHSDRVVQASELVFLQSLAVQLNLPGGRAGQILAAIEALNRDSLAS